MLPLYSKEANTVLYVCVSNTFLSDFSQQQYLTNSISTSYSMLMLLILYVHQHQSVDITSDEQWLTDIFLYHII